MTLDPLAGHVVVLAGAAARAGAELLARGVLLAVVTDDRDVIDELEQTATSHPGAMLLSYRSDPSDPALWERIAAHIEQRVGPIDAVLCTAELTEVLEATFAEDMRRRGHGTVLPVSSAADPVQQLHRHLRDRP